ncbi:D-aminoacyl-tRNA deacylase [Anaeromusa sp.]|uniref:D-aminoacyl-tRNA deacylase n=1 Tax=Anaeromusa sp. TaxID=1872520 RepID=UPI00261BC352|nr:D-aminoacyl-tRNA deacylase [Anaeromusa sp.]MDD3158457.1 D-aminoacyl-tRNA deacylase [Anaeromusa sp.]
MRAVVQRTKSSSVTVDGRLVGSIGPGLTVLLGVGDGDTPKDAVYLADKIVGLRIFHDETGKMNCSLKDVGGSLLVVSQFTLYGDCRKGRRPGFDQAAPPGEAKALYEYFLSLCREKELTVAAGEFQAEMLVALENDGPVTILLDSRKLF